MALLLLAAAIIAIVASQPGGISGRLTFDGRLRLGLRAWTSTGGGAQCANFGTPSVAPRRRGDLSLVSVAGLPAGRFDLPPSRIPAFPLQACELTHPRPLGLGSDDYYGYRFYVPRGWTTGGRLPGDFWGIATAQFHFQNIWGSPVVFELHHDHVTLALETGACHNFRTRDPGCRWRSNADAPAGAPGNLGARYAIPSPLPTGVWNELIMHVHWAADQSGAIQVWHRVRGAPDWTQTVALTGHPTVQWDAARGCCYAAAVDKIGAYRGPAGRPVSVWLGDLLIGSSFSAVAAALP